MLIACGDALIDFVPTRSTEGREAVMPAVGGACLNVAIGMARLGAPTSFVGGISTDLFGRMIADHATVSNVGLDLATRSDHQTTLAFVRIVAGESHYAFYDAETATRNWTYRRGTIPFDAVDALHVGSTTLVNDQGAAETTALVADARASATISFDPNCRPNLVKDKPAYLARMAGFAASADLIKMSDVDFAYLFGDEPYQQRASALLGQGTSLVVITRGNDGAVAWHPGAGRIEVAAPKVEVADTIGAGDSFQAALLFALHKQGRIARQTLKDISADELRRALSFAANCAGLTCTRPGADPPWSHEVSWSL
ncbi:carbohydrate kinase [Bradyrhizobium sp. 180]|uniref:carbohydrate kinase family protein n=1 Tax=unclassified Bradyrhizobium TaxID=2631580 RepID=UPI001FF9DB9B|nr:MULTISPECIES: carbohydrate kinase [unclassified Bradyrhizobium]MCK1421794.1 carbohydrate kinase [Bradyrhizobium sp. CW12]MCK1494247.1 carbohydrate kinase [Bradyrhizobium sp. 180]MCK1530555.1 carbohydrate kinase [Bradyrhizobium sp. 182]MCK1594872.1 carbohydrate kinase [Bradyrhizobium sp. 164]MCK1615762.1 carbohydrate kinase [Bradyrhizobium sp. 159]